MTCVYFYSLLDHWGISGAHRLMRTISCVICPSPVWQLPSGQTQFGWVCWWMMGCWMLAVIGSVSSKERSRRVDGIYPLYLDSLYPCHNQPITLLATISPLLSRPTGRSKDPHWYQYCCIVSLLWFSWPPMLMNPYSMFRPFSVILTSYCTFILWSWQFCLLSAPLWFCGLHTLYCYLFLANWSVHCPALNLLVYN